jgi:hypothetical protein
MRLTAAVTVVVAVGALLSGCSSTRVLKREGCWVRQNETFPGQVREEMGPCSKASPQWAEDRLTRLVQECMAQADYRWEGKALAAWSRGDQMPAQAPEQEVLQACMNEAAETMVTENEGLKTRVNELAGDREALRAEADQGRTHLRDSHDRIALALGEAAKKPAPNAVATATSTSEGKADMKSDNKSELASASETSTTSTERPAAPARKAAPRKQPAPVQKPLASAPACPQPAAPVPALAPQQAAPAPTQVTAPQPVAAPIVPASVAAPQPAPISCTPTTTSNGTR